MLNYVVLWCSVVIVSVATEGQNEDLADQVRVLQAQVEFLMRGQKNTLDINLLDSTDGNQTQDSSVIRALEEEKNHYALLNRDLSQFQVYLKEAVEFKDKQVDVTSQILEIKSEMSELRSDIMELKSELSKVSDERESLVSKQAIKNQEATMEWLKLTVSELKQDVLEIDQQHNISLTIQKQEDTNRQISLIRADLEDILTRIDQVKVENKKCENRLAEATTDLKTVFRYHDDLAETVTQVKNKLDGSSWAASKTNNNGEELNTHHRVDELNGVTVKAHHHHRGGHLQEIKFVKAVLEKVEQKVARLESQLLALQSNSSVVSDLLLDVRQKVMTSNVVTEVRSDWQDQFQSTAITLSDRLSVLEEVSLQNTNELVNLTSTIMSLHGVHEATVKIFSMLDRLGDEVDDNIAEFKMQLAELHFQSTQFSSSLEVLKQDQADQGKTLSVTQKDLLLYREKQQSDHYRLMGLHNQLLNQSLIACNKENTDLLQDLKIAKIEKKLSQSSSQFSTLQVKAASLESSLGNKVDVEHHQSVSKTAHNLTNNILELRDILKNLTEVSNTFSRQLPSDCQHLRKTHPGLKLPTATLLMINRSHNSDDILKPVGVWCEEDVEKEVWTVIQRRIDGSENFYRNWSDYVTGFGTAEGEFWVGLSALHELTKNGDQELSFEMWDSKGTFLVANYQDFVVGTPSSNYRLQIGGYNGNATDAMSHHQNMEFSTADRDHDASSTHCAQYYLGGWWYGHCQYANVNGRYGVALTWYDVEMHTWIELSRVQMKIRTKPTPFDS